MVIGKDYLKKKKVSCTLTKCCTKQVSVATQVILNFFSSLSRLVFLAQEDGLVFSVVRGNLGYTVYLLLNRFYSAILFYFSGFIYKPELDKSAKSKVAYIW